MKKYLKNVLISLDQLLNAMLGGDPDETICSRVWKASQRGEGWAQKARIVLDEVFGRNHCQESEESDEGGDSAL